MEFQVILSYDLIEKGFFDNTGTQYKRIQYWRELPSTDGLKLEWNG